MILIGAAATLAAVAWAIVLLSPASDHPSATTASDNAPDAPLTTLAVQSEQIPAPAAAAGRSMVQLQADTSHGVVSLVGVAVAEGGLVATTADGLSRAAEPLHDRHRRPAGCGPRWWPSTTPPIWPWSACPTTFRWPRSPTTPR
jgi:hypothetical protein